jgi:hypothetical protein
MGAGRVYSFDSHVRLAQIPDAPGMWRLVISLPEGSERPFLQIPMRLWGPTVADLLPVSCKVSEDTT